MGQLPVDHSLWNLVTVALKLINQMFVSLQIILIHQPKLQTLSANQLWAYSPWILQYLLLFLLIWSQPLWSHFQVPCQFCSLCNEDAILQCMCSLHCIWRLLKDDKWDGQMVHFKGKNTTKLLNMHSNESWRIRSTAYRIILWLDFHHWMIIQISSLLLLFYVAIILLPQPPPGIEGAVAQWVFAS